MNRLVIGILAHVDAGKTTLSEGILYTSGKIRQLGRVDKKDAFLDNYALERERGITIYSKQAVFDYNNVSFTLLDTPGHVDFSTEMERTLSVLDAAVLVISGPDGIQAHTRTLWKLLKSYDIPVFIFVNKMDRPGCDKSLINEELNRMLSGSCLDFDGVTDKDIPEELLENIALCDESLMERFLKGATIDDEVIRDLIGNRKLFPCIYGSALKVEGVDRLLNIVSRFAPRYEDDTECSGRVYKIGRDNDNNRLTYVKLNGGSVRTRETLFKNCDEKITQIRVYSGEKYEAIEKAEQGMVVALLGFTGTYPGQCFGNEEEAPSPVLAPVMTYGVAGRDRKSLMELIPKLRLMEEEEPSLGIVWNDEVHELQVNIMGEVQLEVIKSRMQERFGENVEFDRGHILYKETIKAPVIGVGHYEPLRHYAEAQLLIEPGKRGSGIEAVSSVSTDELELNWQRLIITHVYEKEHKGVLLGAALTDVKITLIAGRAHQKHTEGGDFRQATYRAIRQGLMKSESVILEPYYDFTMEIPRSCCGRAMSDIDKKCGKITLQQESEQPGNDMIILCGKAPVQTMQGYSKEITAYTSGLGSIYTSFGGYMECHNSDEVTAEVGYDAEADMFNASSSVFCAHGAGFVVPWNEVDKYKHIDMRLDLRVYTKPDNENHEDNQSSGIRVVRKGEPVRKSTSSVNNDPWMTVGEVDDIIERTFFANKKLENYKNPYRKHKQQILERQIKYNSHPIKNTKERYLLVDGYNIIFAWKELAELAAANIDAARDRLNEIMCNYQAMHDLKLTVVYDAYRVAGHRTEMIKHNNISLIFTKEAETADRFIERFAHENAAMYNITVATSDGLEQIIIRGAGCNLMTASDLYADVGRTSERIEEILKSKL